MRLRDDDVRYLGADHRKHVLLVSVPGGALEALADRIELENAVELSRQVRRILEGEPTAGQLAALVPLLVTALDRVIAVAGQDVA
jgi:hypothetical protein